MANLITSGGNVVEVNKNEFRTYGGMLYQGKVIDDAGLEVKSAWIVAQAGETRKGLVVQLEDNVGNIIAGPATTFGGSELQPMRLFPFRNSALRKTGPPQVLLIKAHNVNYDDNDPPSLLAQLSLELGTK